MDVGVGTGYYLAKSKVAPTTEVTLIDLNKNSLEATAARIAHRSPNCIQHDIYEPLPLSGATLFDSISAFYLLHCLPGTMAERGEAIANLKAHLAPSGTLYGATILGDIAEHNWFGSKLMAVYNRKGIFCNRADSIQTLRKMLEQHFQNVDISQNGKVALFAASSVTSGASTI
jgi:SAM-dependent methyltransferase